MDSTAIATRVADSDETEHFARLDELADRLGERAPRARDQVVPYGGLSVAALVLTAHLERARCGL